MVSPRGVTASSHHGAILAVLPVALRVSGCGVTVVSHGWQIPPVASRIRCGIGLWCDCCVARRLDISRPASVSAVILPRCGGAVASRLGTGGFACCPAGIWLRCDCCVARRLDILRPASVSAVISPRCDHTVAPRQDSSRRHSPWSAFPSRISSTSSCLAWICPLNPGLMSSRMTTSVR